MGFEIVDRRGGNKEVSAVEVVEDRMERLSTATLNGDAEGAAAVAAECQNPPATYGNVTEFKRTVRGEVQGWKGDVSFLMVSMPIGKLQVFMCRAVGIRTDEQLFIADYAIPPIWDKGEDMSAEAEKRLATFLGCSCDRKGRCKFHGEALPGPNGAGKWLEADIKRLQRIQGAPLPEAVEVLMRAEAERANSRIVVPR